MRLLFPYRAAAVAALVVTASACSSTFSSLPAPNFGPRSVSPSAAADNRATRQGYATLRLRIWVPGRTHDSAAHRVLPAYVSSATRKVAVAVQGANQKIPTTQKFACTAVCSGKITAPLGVDNVTIQLEDKKGRVLSRGTATVLVFKKNGNVIDFTLDGVPASVSVVLQSNVIPVVPASAGYATFEALDSDGRIITPDGHYVDADGNPLVFDIKSSNKSFRLAATTVSAPGMPIPYRYDGKQHVGTFTLSPVAHKGVKTSVALKTTVLRLVPGIARRIAPPLPVLLLTATQVPVPSGATACSNNPCFDGNAIFLMGNSGDQSATLKLDVTDGAYGQSFLDGTRGPFANPPIEYAIGFYGEFNQNGLFGFVEDAGDSGTIDSGLTTSPCGLSPIGESSSGTLYCSEQGVFGSTIFDETHGSTVAVGQDKKIQEIDGTTYFETVAEATPSPTQRVYVSGNPTPVAGAISVGADTSNTSTVYFGGFDGTVKQGTTTVAQFTHAVGNVLGSGTSIYVYEANGVFGVRGPAGTFESEALPIGPVLELVAGINGAPTLVETNGTLDLMGI